MVKIVYSVLLLEFFQCLGNCRRNSCDFETDGLFEQTTIARVLEYNNLLPLKDSSSRGESMKIYVENLKLRTAVSFNIMFIVHWAETV